MTHKWTMKPRDIGGVIIYDGRGEESGNVVAVIPRNRPRSQEQAEAIAREMVEAHNAE